MYFNFLKGSRKQVAILLVLVLCFTLNGCRGLFFNPRICLNKSLKNQPYDAVIVPGVPFDSTWNIIMKTRVIWSVHLYKQGIAKNIIYSGASVYTPYVEAKIMAMYAEKLGVPRQNIYIENRAEHGKENVYYGTVLARKNGFRSIALATDRLQTRTLYRYIGRMRANIKMLPIPDSVFMNLSPVEPKIDYQEAYVSNFVPLPKREGIFKRFNGTLGNNIKINRDSLR